MGLLNDVESSELGAVLLHDESQPFAFRRNTISIQRAVARSLERSPPPPLVVAWVQRKLFQGQLVALDQDVYFKGLRRALDLSARGTPARATFLAKLDVDPAVRVRGDYSPEHLTSTTAYSWLSGRQHVFILGYITNMDNEQIGLRPVVIADRIYLEDPGPESFPRAAQWEKSGFEQQLHPSAIDAFARADWDMPDNLVDIRRLKNIPESTIKQSFADAIGEPDVPNDWGGEKSDLWTTRLAVRRQRVPAAFLFKGPGKRFAPMDISLLGARGDQIDRLFSEPAEILVLQHCHYVKAPVVNMMRAYASDVRRPRRFIVIDGYDTYRILRHLKVL